MSVTCVNATGLVLTTTLAPLIVEVQKRIAGRRPPGARP
jgi:hypothetical protein